MSATMAREGVRDSLDGGAIDAVVQGRHGDPFAVLGPHPEGDGVRVRALLPDAEAAELIDRQGKPLGRMERLHEAGLFSGVLAEPGPYRLRVQGHGGSYEAEDPYRFGATLGPLDLHLLTNGVHRDVGLTLGAHEASYDGVDGVRFAVWAPNAQRVSVVGDFNFWDARRHPMRKQVPAGVWEMFVPGVKPGAVYKYDLLGPDWSPLPQKADPVAWAAEAPPATGSIIVSSAPFRWTDAAWMERRAAAQQPGAPISAYEVHAASWLPFAENGAAGHPGPTAPAWASRTSNCSPSWNTRSGVPGATSRSASTPPVPGSARRTISPPSSTAATPWASASCSTGCRRTSPPTRMASPASTARRSMSTAIPAKASTRTGTPSSTTSAATK